MSTREAALLLLGVAYRGRDRGKHRALTLRNKTEHRGMFAL